MAYKKVIVTTSINPPTEALIKFSKLSDWHLVVVGDLKTPTEFHIDNATYISPLDQEKISKELSDLIGWNCIQRRNFGFIWAYNQGAEIVATVDDDNIPYPNWGDDSYVNKKIEVDYYESDDLVFDPLSVTNYKNIWHRGFPIQNLKTRFNTTKKAKELEIHVEAGFWNGDPDIDAICRMEHYPETNFDSKDFPFSGGPYAPFNSQNTILSAKVLPDYFLFPEIGRMDDIWASYWLESKGFNVIYSQASVFQRRNEHDLTKDFQLEIIGHVNSRAIIESLHKEGPDSIWNYLPPKSRSMYEIYKNSFL